MTINLRLFVLPLATLALALVSTVNADGPVRDWTLMRGTFEEDAGYSVKVEHCGRVNVVGRTQGAFDGYVNPGGNDAYLLSFSTSDPQNVTINQWHSGNNDRATGVDVDPCGNRFVVGSMGDLGHERGFVRKFDVRGHCVYHREFHFGHRTLPEDCVVDGSGTVFVYGRASTLEAVTFVFIQVYDCNGRLRKTLKLGHDSFAQPTAGEITLDHCGRPIIAGYTNGPLAGINVNGRSDGFIARVSHNLEWDFVQLSGLPGNELSSGVTVMPDGRILTTGARRVVVEGSQANNRRSDATATAIDRISYPNFIVDWGIDGSTRRELITSLNGGGHSISAISNEHAFISSATFVAKVNIDSGAVEWKEAFPWTTGGSCVDALGRFYVTGAANYPMHGQPVKGKNDVFVVRYSR
ncbi:hypothetical protein [Stieleria varia]|uniref:Beta-propeller repeat protein n=1 Tax=Stieleria varia TaxID=2528005 RepID=A0A5C6AGK7_9BACT|nr:hypothetical protein [Stieleria varia]TWT98580.1 hypothetical protein Pla52n_50960 [Stieleria varia]